MIDVGKHERCASQLSSCADRVAQIKRAIKDYAQELKLVWVSSEVNDIVGEIDSIAAKLGSVESSLRGVGPDIVSAARTIRERQEEEEEEEERRRQEEEAAAAAASGGTA